MNGSACDDDLILYSWSVINGVKHYRDRATRGLQRGLAVGTDLRNKAIFIAKADRVFARINERTLVRPLEIGRCRPIDRRCGRGRLNLNLNAIAFVKLVFDRLSKPNF